MPDTLELLVGERQPRPQLRNLILDARSRPLLRNRFVKFFASGSGSLLPGVGVAQFSYMTGIRVALRRHRLCAKNHW